MPIAPETILRRKENYQDELAQDERNLSRDPGLSGVAHPQDSSALQELTLLVLGIRRAPARRRLQRAPPKDGVNMSGELAGLG